MIDVHNTLVLAAVVLAFFIGYFLGSAVCEADCKEVIIALRQLEVYPHLRMTENMTLDAMARENFWRQQP